MAPWNQSTNSSGSDAKDWQGWNAGDGTRELSQHLFSWAPAKKQLHVSEEALSLPEDRESKTPASSGLAGPLQLALSPGIVWEEESLTCLISSHCHTRNGQKGTRIWSGILLVVPSHEFFFFLILCRRPASTGCYASWHCIILSRFLEFPWEILTLSSKLDFYSL